MSAVLGVVVVLYRKSPDELPALRMKLPIESAHLIRLIVVDNSPEIGTEVEDYCASRDAQYVWMGRNSGLSAAYNRGVRELGDRVDWVCFLDQDTDNVEGYLQRALSRLDEARADVLLPTVIAGDGVMSPCRRTWYWYRPLRQRGVLPREMSWINSGMIARRELLWRIPFDERLFLDYVDHQFALSALAAHATVQVLWEEELHQDYSRSTDSIEQAIRRFRIFRQDIHHFYRQRPLGRLWGAVLVGWRATSATMQYRTLAFVRIGGPFG